MKKVSIVLENCEYYEFKREDVDVYLDGLRLNYWGDWDKHWSVRNCLLLIKKQAKPLNKLEDWQDTDWAKRIHKDITQIQIDGETYCVRWETSAEYENPYENDLDWHDRRAYVISKQATTVEGFFDIID